MLHASPYYKAARGNVEESSIVAIQFLPIIKAVAPYVAQVAAAAIPAFTAKPEAAKLDPLLAQQIEELQSAATQNAESIHVLAEKMQQAIQALEVTAQEARTQVAAYKTLLFFSFALALLSLFLSVYLVLR